MKPWTNLQSKKTLVTIGAALGIVTVSVCTLAAVQTCWLTPGEQSAARSALTTIDDLRDFGSINGEEADAKVRQAEDAVEAARQTAQTSRDQDVAVGLMQYLSSIELERQAVRTQGTSGGQAEVPAAMQLKPSNAAHVTETASSRSLSLKLHQTLD